MAKPKSTTALKKTETLTLRLDPKMKFAIEMLARSQKRTLAGVIEWAISRAIAEQPGPGESTFAEMIDKVWSSDESVRFVNMAYEVPELLTYDELRVWETIKVSPAFWRSGDGVRDYSRLNLEEVILKYQWSNLRKHVDENSSNPIVDVFPVPGKPF